MTSLRYPPKWIRQAPLLALPAQFCRGKKVNVRQAIVDFFLEGHPLHLLTHKVCFVCESKPHSSMCPNNVSCIFGENDFYTVYSAIKSSDIQRPNLQSELESWARRVLCRGSASILRLMITFPELQIAFASVIAQKRQEIKSSFYAPPSVIYTLICSRHLSLDFVSLAWVMSTHQMLSAAVPDSADIEAHCAFNLWVRYLEGTSNFNELPLAFQTHIAVNVAFLCTAQYTPLPTLPSEIGQMIYTALFKL